MAIPRFLSIPAAAIQSYFRAESDAIDLAVFRIVVFGWLLLRVSDLPIHGFEHIPIELRVPPPGYGPLLHAIPFGGLPYRAALWVGLVSCAMAFVGLCSRSGALVGCITSAYLLGLPEFFGKINHVHQHLIWFSLLLAFSPCGDALSVDSQVRAWRGQPAPASPSRAYGFPIRVAWLLMGVAYFFPGVAKLSAGSEWYLSDSLRNIMYGFWSGRGFLPWFRIDQYPLLMRATAVGTIAFEISFIFLIFSRRLRPFVAVAGVLFHILIWVYMRINFLPLLCCYVTFVDWGAVSRTVAERARLTPLVHQIVQPSPRRRAAPGRPVVRSTVWPVGAALLVVNVWCGILTVDSWPFSAYPRFDWIERSASRTTLEISVRRATGEIEVVASTIRRAALKRLVRDHNIESAFRALRDAIAARGVVLGAGDKLRITETTRSTIPEARDRRPLRERVLIEWPRSD